jgi:single-strand DNA-binding protein
MKGIEACFQGVLGKDVELKTSKSGTLYAALNIVVTVGKDDDGKDVGQWVRVTCFKEVAKEIAATAKKGSRLYCEGQLSLDAWTAADGEKRTGLSVMAWKCEKLAQIGKNRPKRAASGPDDKPADHGAVKKGRHEFNDPLPF